MKQRSPWFRPSKTPGKPSVRTHQLYPPEIAQALGAIAAEESVKYGIRVSPANLLTTYALKDETFSLRYEQILKENRHELKPTSTPKEHDLSD